MARVGAKVTVTDDDGKPHTATVTGWEQVVKGLPFRIYELVIDDSGQILNLSPEQFKEKSA